MAYEAQQAVKLSLEAGADLSNDQYKFVKLNASGQAILCAAATDVPVGVLQNNPSAAGRMAEIVCVGVTKINGDAALNEADLIGTSADGQADAKTPGTDTTNYIVGQMLTATGAAAEIGTAVVNCAAPVRAA